MKSFIKHALLLVVFMITVFSGFSQNHIMKLGDTLFLKMPAFRGNLQWQESTDSITWKDILGATKQPYAVLFITPKYYRGKVTEGSCGAVYTNVTKTVKAPVIGVSDIDGNVYDTIRIGQQVWFTQDLKTTKLNDGSAIPLVTDNIAWGALLTPAYCNYNNSTSMDTINTYGRLYNWYTVNTNKLCPIGYHVPTDAEWTTLIDYSGGASVAGGKLKATSGWANNINGTDVYGFKALPDGARVLSGAFNSIGTYGNWWSANEINTGSAIYRSMNNAGGDVINGDNYKRHGYSVRCIQDEKIVSIQQQLNFGKSVKELLTLGVKVDSLYGKTYQGGLIFYVDTINGSGMVAAPSDQGEALWGCWQTDIIGADSTKIGYGRKNTSDILASCVDEGIAAKLCDDLVVEFQSDWFLPSKEELNQLYIKKDIIGGFVNSSYWTSSDVDSFVADYQDFANGYMSSMDKINSANVRAVRYFDLPISGIKDMDGNIYDTVRIGTQVWFKQNLKTTKYNDSTAIAFPNTNQAEWLSNTTGAYAYFNLDTTYLKMHGAYYNFYAVISGKLCPAGFHVPTNLEWKTLFAFVGTEANAAKQLKTIDRWNTDGVGDVEAVRGTDAFGFSALPGGNYLGTNLDLPGYDGGWWSSTESDVSNALGWGMDYDNIAVRQNTDAKNNGYSIRCLKD